MGSGTAKLDEGAKFKEGGAWEREWETTKENAVPNNGARRIA